MKKIRVAALLAGLAALSALASSLYIDAAIRDGGINLDRRVAGLAVTTAGADWDYRRVEVGTGAVSEIAFGAQVGTAGWAFVYCASTNTATTNRAAEAVVIGIGTTNQVLRCLAGEPAVFRLAAGITSLHLLGISTGAASVAAEVYIREN